MKVNKIFDSKEIVLENKSKFLNELCLIYLSWLRLYTVDIQ